MAPTTECNSCGARRWMRDGQGGYVCPRGHAYTHQEELGDDEAMLGVQTRTIKKSSRKSSSSKRSKDSGIIRLAPHLRILQFQYSLSEQVTWLVERKNMPAHIEGIVRDLWLAWLKQAGISTMNLKSDSVAVYSTSGLLKPSYTLVFLHIATFVLKRGIFYSDFVTWTMQEDFPYFAENSINRYWQNNFGGYPPIPSFTEFQRYETAILNQLYEAGCKFSFSLDQPNLVIRLMEELELPLECYTFYKTISALRGSHIQEAEPIWKCFLHISVCCLFVARAYHKHSNFCKIPTSSLDVLVPFPSDISRPFLSTMTRIIPQKKRGVDKVAYGLFQRYARENDILLKSIIEPDPDILRRDIRPFFKESVLWPREIKSYYSKDIDGARCPVYANLLLRTSNMVGLTPLKLENHSRALDMLINCYSVSLNSSSEKGTDSESKSEGSESLQGGLLDSDAI